MKKKLLFFAALFMELCSVQADEVVVNDITIPQGGEATLNIELNNTTAFTRFSLDLVLPNGVTVTGQTLGKRFATSDHTVRLGTWPEWYRFIGDTEESMVIPGTNGTLIAVTLKAEETLSVGSTYQGILTGYNQDNGEEIGMEFTTVTDVPVLLNRVTFAVTIGEPAANRKELNEESTEEIEAATDVDVRVLRTITANQWSTICLPFAMTEAQCKEAFGDDVELADFTSYDIEQNEAKETVGITVNFTDVTAIEANHPYIIKVGADISEFSVDGVTIAPDEEGAYTQFDNGETGRKQVIYGWFVGTYHADTTVPADCLFLSDNNFWYSAGQTKMKAFRAYFELNDKLTHPADDTQADSRLRLHIVPGETTGIAEKSSAVRLGHTATYDLQGRRVTSPRGKGLYISEGRKIIVK